MLVVVQYAPTGQWRVVETVTGVTLSEHGTAQDARQALRAQMPEDVVVEIAEEEEEPPAKRSHHKGGRKS